jgi:putative transposase
MKNLILRVFAILISGFRKQSDLAIENIALRQQLAVLKEKRKRPRLSNRDRFFWVWLSRAWSRWKEALIIVQPETVIRWHRKGFGKYWALKSRHKNAGRPEIDAEIRALIRRISKENPSWGAPRIHGELLMLGFDVSESTITRYMPKRTPDKDKTQRWKTFLKNHRPEIAAMDFFTVPTISCRFLHGFFIIEHETRRILHCNVTFHPSSEWVIQQLRDAFPSGNIPKYLIFDRDSIFSRGVVAALKTFGITAVRTSYRSPWQNGIAERWVGNCRRELLDHIIPFGEKHLRKLLRDYVLYYNRDRTHCGLGKKTPVSRRVRKRSRDDTGPPIALPRVCGIHHKYVWRNVA